MEYVIANQNETQAYFGNKYEVVVGGCRSSDDIACFL